MAVPTWAYAQADLFDAPLAEKALTDAVERFERKASLEWLAAAREAIRLIAEYRSTFTTDVVWAILVRWGIEPPREERAMGAAMRQAQKLGWIQTTDQMTKSIRPACHKRKLTIWRSLVCTYVQSDEPCPYHFYTPAEPCPYVHADDMVTT